MSDDTLFAALKSKPLSDLSGDEMRAATDLAWNILRADYWRDVRGLVADAKQAIEGKEVTDADELTEYIEQSCDGSARVIYTRQAMECLLISDNSDAYADDFGSEGMVKDDAINWSALAYCALLADVRDELGDVDDLFAEEDEADDSDADAEGADDEPNEHDWRSGHEPESSPAE